MSFNGQRYTALKLFMVHESIAGDFVQRFATEINKLKPGHLAEMIADATSQGARIMNEGGGTTVGPLVYPALLYQVKDGMKIWRKDSAEGTLSVNDALRSFSIRTVVTTK